MEASRSEAVTPLINPRKNGDYWQYVPDFGHSIDDKPANLRQGSIKDYDMQDDTLTTEVPCREEDSVGESSLPSTGGFRSGLTNTRTYHRHRIRSAPSVGSNQAGSSGIKRTTSATEIRTRLLCPRGLLIATEPPKSGETYRLRSNTDVFTRTKAISSLELRNKRNNDSSNDDSLMNNLNQSDNIIQKEHESILVELEAVKYERCLLQKENKRLQEELDNRNKVIDHLIDYMKSNMPSVGGQFGDLFSDVDN